MLDLILKLLSSLFIGLRRRAAMQAEIIALRHQLTVLQRTKKAERFVLNRGDRFLWVWLSTIVGGLALPADSSEPQIREEFVRTEGEAALSMLKGLVLVLSREN
jgi:hypothetical protein